MRVSLLRCVYVRVYSLGFGGLGYGEEKEKGKEKEGGGKECKNVLASVFAEGEIENGAGLVAGVPEAMEAAHVCGSLEACFENL